MSYHDPSKNQKTHYEVLNVSPDSTLSEIKAVHRSLALKYHPDKNLGGETNNETDADVKFIAIQKAWECLRDEKSRRLYDDELKRRHYHEEYKHISTVLIDELDAEECDLEVEDENTVKTISTIVYTYSCQCGTVLELFQHDLSSEKRESIPWQCHGCSVEVQIIIKR